MYPDNAELRITKYGEINMKILSLNYSKIV